MGEYSKTRDISSTNHSQISDCSKKKLQLQQGMLKNVFEPQNRRKAFFNPSKGVRGHAPPKNLTLSDGLKLHIKLQFVCKKIQGVKMLLCV